MHKKSAAFHKHGKHASALMEVRQLQKKPSRRQEWFASVVEAVGGRDLRSTGTGSRRTVIGSPGARKRSPAQEKRK